MKLIKHIPWEILEAGYKDRLPAYHFTDYKPGTEYIGLFEDQVLKGIVGYRADRKTGKAILKNDYTFPEFRNQGVFMVLNLHRLDYLRQIGITVIETKPSG